MYIAFSGVGRLEDVSERKAAVSVLNVWSKRMYVCRCGGGGRGGGGGARSWRERYLEVRVGCTGRSVRYPDG